MAWESFDVEVGADKPEYRLQPWVQPYGKAWLRCWAVAKADSNQTYIADPDPKNVAFQLHRLMRDWIERDVTVCTWNGVYDIAWIIAYGGYELAAKVKWLDGMLLRKHWEQQPEYTLKGEQKKKFGLKDTVAEYLPRFAGYDDGVDFEGPLMPLLAYNAMDAYLTRGLTRWFWLKLEENPQRLRAALIESHCLADVARANVNGLMVDESARRILDEKLRQAQQELLAELKEEGATAEILASPQQLSALMFGREEGQWDLTPLKMGKKYYSTDKETLLELAVEDDRALKVQQYREAKGNHTKFVTKVAESAAYNCDGKTHPQARIYGTYCVPGDVEVLTRDGWVRLDSWTGGEIMQARPDLSMQFLPAERFVGPVTDNWVHAKMQSFDCMFTPGHTVPFLAQETWKWRTTQAHNMLSGQVRNIPTAGIAELQGNITPAQMRLLVAVQADGYVTDRYTKFTFSKQRKITRLKTLLDACGVRYRENSFSSYPGRVEITIAKSFRPSWMSADRKVFGPWVLDTTPDGLQALVDELQYWDGSIHPDGRGTQYTSAIQENVTWAVTAAAMVGRKAAEHKPQKQASGNSIYSCLISNQRPIRAVLPRYVSEVRCSQQAYCATTETGFWLARSKGHIFITGNTGRFTYSSFQGRGKAACQTGFAIHQMKRSKEYRSLIRAPKGFVVGELDAAGQEFSLMAEVSQDDTMRMLCQPGEDAHSYMGARVSGVDYREIQEGAGTDKRLGGFRQLGKVANFSLQYRTSAKTLLRSARIGFGMMDMTLLQAERIHRIYQQTYPGVPRYWRRQCAFIRQHHYVSTLAGRRINVPAEQVRLFEWSAESTSINFPVQGSGGDQKYLALSVVRPLMREMGVVFMFDLHDGLYFQIPEEFAEEFLQKAQHLFNHLPYAKAWGYTPSVPLTWDVKMGYSWGSMEEIKF